MTNSPLISVLTPSYNQAQFLAVTLESVARQSYPVWEHIIMDGGSQDSSVEIIQNHAARYPKKVHWVSEPDHGQADAVNKAFSYSKGEIIGWLNSDDGYFTRTTLEEVAAAFAAHPEVDVLYGDAVLIDVHNRLLRILPQPAYRAAGMLRACRISQPAAFFRRRVMETHRLDADISIVMDYEYWLRLGQAGTRFKHLPRLWAVDRNHPARKIIAQRDQLAAQRTAVQRKYGRADSGIVRWVEKLTLGLPLRLAGVRSLLDVYHLSPDNLAVPLVLDPLPATLWRQLVKRNRDLV